MCLCVWDGAVNVILLFDFAGRAGGAQNTFMIISVSHICYFILWIYFFPIFNH